MKIDKVVPLLAAAALVAGFGFNQEARGGGGAGQGLEAVFRAPDKGKASGTTQEGRKWLGVKVGTLPLRMDEGEPPVPAAEVMDVAPGSAAAKAGLRKGDIIVGIEMRPFEDAGDFDRALAKVPAGGRASLQLVRSGEPMELIVTRGGSKSPSGLASAAGHATDSVASPGGGRTQARTGIFINGREITPAQVQQLRATYGYVAPAGRYWYDTRSGLYGVMGWEAAGFMQPGHNFGQLPPNASNGNTGVFINGRQINMAEAMFCQRLFGAVYRGRWWLDGRTGNLGAEGSPVPIANVYMALQQSQRSSQGGGGYSWHSKVTGASGGSDGKCSYVSIPGSGSVMTGNCD